MTHSSISTVLAAAVAALLLDACATSHVMLGKARPPISPDQVQIYDRPPPGPYQEIARLDTSSQGSFSFTAQAKTDAVIKRLKTEAVGVAFGDGAAIKISAKDFMFSPATVTVKAGSTVTWTNLDDEPHAVFSDAGLF